MSSQGTDFFSIGTILSNKNRLGLVKVVKEHFL